MLETAETGRKVSKAYYHRALPALRAALLEAQAQLFAQQRRPVVVLISGEDGAGKRETIHALYEWMDPRFLRTVALDDPTQEERERPPMWRYWRTLPPKGHIGIFSGSWYSDPIRLRMAGHISQKRFEAQAQRIERFETMLVQEGAIVLKLWIHLGKDAQRRRLHALEADPRTAWRVTPWHWERLKTYDKLQHVASHLLALTHKPHAPWVVVDGEDEHYRALQVARVLLDALGAPMPRKQQRRPAPKPPVAGPVPKSAPGLAQLAEHAGPALTQRRYKAELALYQGRLSELARHHQLRKRSIVLALEGPDAAGKGGAIRRITQALDARQFQIIPVAAPTDEEQAQPYLWRFWRNLPRWGHWRVFDRSWYGRVLVERVEGLCSPADWERAYGEINDFEGELVAARVIVVKFWLQISQDEQLRRFRAREQTAFKRFKITREDWRNRAKWQAYQGAITEMVERTSTSKVPWDLIEANDKDGARLEILRRLCQRLEQALALS